MYLPAHFRGNDTATLLHLISEHPFATLITHGEEGVIVNHLPLLAETGDLGEIVLFGHMARANPQWRSFADREALAIFHGPHAYITPLWYPDPFVPTWNYAVVHASGRATAIESRDGIETILGKTVATFERHEPKPWTYDLPEDFRADLVKAVVGFEIRVACLEGKLKLNQNREPADRAGVLEGLATRTDEMSRKTLELMRALERP